MENKNFENPSVEEIVSQIVEAKNAGDTHKANELFEVLYTSVLRKKCKLWTYVYRNAYDLHGSHFDEDFEDYVQEFLIRIFEKIHKYDTSRRAFLPYARKVFMNYATDFWRRLARVSKTTSIDDISVDIPDTENHHQALDNRSALYAIIPDLLNEINGLRPAKPVEKKIIAFHFDIVLKQMVKGDADSYSTADIISEIAEMSFLAVTNKCEERYQELLSLPKKHHYMSVMFTRLEDKGIADDLYPLEASINTLFNRWSNQVKIWAMKDINTKLKNQVKDLISDL